MSATVAAAAPPVLSPGRLAAIRFGERPAAVLGAAVVVGFILVAALAPLIAPYDPLATSWLAIRKASFLGALDGYRRTRTRRAVPRQSTGARASMMAGVVSVAIAAVIGIPMGVVAGFVGGWVDFVLSRIIDAMLACPFLILAIALAAFLGPDLTNAMIAIGVQHRAALHARRPRRNAGGFKLRLR